MNAGREVLFELRINVQRRYATAPMYRCIAIAHVRRLTGSATWRLRDQQVERCGAPKTDSDFVHALSATQHLTPEVPTEQASNPAR